MSKPALLIHTVYFAPEDRGEAEALGFALYEQVTRWPADKLAFGPGIPVRIAASPGSVNPHEAAHVVVVPVLGQSSAQDEEARDSVVTHLRSWEESLAGKGTVRPLFTSKAWLEFRAELPVPPLLTHLNEDAGQGFGHTLLELTIGVCRLLRGPNDKLRVFVSHAPSDSASTHRATQRIHDFANASATVRSFLDTIDLEPGINAGEELERAARDGIFLAVRSDAYASRPWCQRELLWAKRAGLPVLSVEVLRGGEARSYPYAGNGPTIVWPEATDDARENARRVLLRALVEWLRARHFELEAERLAVGLPKSAILSRPPELLDLAQGPLFDALSSVVLHPDPELSYAEREVLRAARPRIKLVTPTTLYRGIEDASRGASPLPFAPLRGRQIALSVSDVVDGSVVSEGLRREHLDDAVVYVTRALIGAGAAIAYGGDLRLHGYDDVLSELIATYNAAGVDRAKYVYSYLPANFERSKIRESLAVNVRALGWTKEVMLKSWAERAKPVVWPASSPLYLSDMRHVMALECFARVIVGGQSQPRQNGQDRGYVGAFPGVVEEAWHTLKLGRPLYVVGGFGGAAALVAALAEAPDVPPLLRAESFSSPEYSAFRERARAFEADAERRRLGVPGSLAELALAIREQLGPRFASDATAQSFNGLTLAENKELAKTRDVVRIAALVTQGLFNVLRAQTSGKLRIELVRGNVVRAERAQLVAIPSLRDVDVTGAAAALDEASGGAVSRAKRERTPLVECRSPLVDAEWLLLADLGEFATLERAKLQDLIQEQAERVAQVAQRHNFQRIALVTFAATILDDVEAIAAHMLSGLRGVSEWATLQWFETDERRFERLRAFLEDRPEVALTVREASDVVAEPTPQRGDLVAFVRLANGTLRSTLLLPTGPAVSRERSSALDAAALAALNRAGSSQAPALKELERVGDELGQLLFGEGAELLDHWGRARLVVQHDLASAALPFETLRVNGHRLAVEGGLVRRPSLEGRSLLNGATRAPRAGKLRLLLIVAPGDDLTHIEGEAAAIKRALAQSEAVIDDELVGARATKAAVLKALARDDYDVLHFSGHAFFERLDAHGSGLICANGERLELGDLTGIEIGPRIAFFNACESARVRGRPRELESGALAEYMLESGVEAFIGTHWPVKDDAAAHFAAQVYRQLAGEKPLDEAVRIAREFLLDNQRSDWANYALYGNGAFRLKTR